MKLKSCSLILHNNLLEPNKNIAVSINEIFKTSSQFVELFYAM